jgi:hypothetical protein
MKGVPHLLIVATHALNASRCMAATHAEQAAQPHFTINIMAQRSSVETGSELRVKGDAD